MTDQTPDLAALEALAEAATPGPWTSYRPHPAYRSYMVERVAPEGHLAGDGAVVCCEDVKASENAEFIAAADPATVLWLIREVERLTRWKSEALPVLDGLQELGRALGLPLGERITGPAALEAVERLRRQVDTIRARWDETIGHADEYRARAEAAETDARRLRESIAGSPDKAQRLASLVASSTRLVQIERDDARARAEKAEAELASIRAAARPDRFRCCECCKTEHLAEGREDDDLIDNHEIACQHCQDPEKRRAEKAEATIERVRAALANHPRACEAHPEDDPISCGWKRAVLDVQTALDGGEPDA